MNAINSLTDRSVEILKSIPYAVLATVTPDGRPWNSPVRVVVDPGELKFYWFSDKEGQHSMNVRNNWRVFMVVFDSTVPEGQGAGVYFEAKAEEVTDPVEVAKARRLKNEGVEPDPAMFLGEAIRRVYRAVPERAWANDVEWSGQDMRDMRVELDLKALARSISRD